MDSHHPRFSSAARLNHKLRVSAGYTGTPTDVITGWVKNNGVEAARALARSLPNPYLSPEGAHGLVNAKHTERYFTERGRLPKEHVQPPTTLDADERLELGEVLLRQHQPGVGKYDEAGVERYFGRRDTQTG